MNKRSGLLATGIVIVIVGLLTAMGLWYSAGQREADAVRNLARAPIGCDTTLAFDDVGEFLVFVETDGDRRDVPGSCAVSESTFGQLGAPQDLPPVRLTMTDSSGVDVALDAKTGVDYDADRSKGQVIRSFVIDEPGDFTMRVQVPEGAEPAVFQVAVGRDPSEGVAPLRLGAIAAAVAGLAVGLGLVMMSRRRATTAPVDTDPWSGTAVIPTSPPGWSQQPAEPGWQQTPGPPTQPPSMPAPAQPSQPPIPGQPPFSVPSPPPSAPSVSPSDPSVSPWQASPDQQAQPGPTGASGDGERSPWAPPDSQGL